MMMMVMMVLMTMSWSMGMTMVGIVMKRQLAYGRRKINWAPILKLDVRPPFPRITMLKVTGVKVQISGQARGTHIPQHCMLGERGQTGIVLA